MICSGTMFVESRKISMDIAAAVMILGWTVCDSATGITVLTYFVFSYLTYTSRPIQVFLCVCMLFFPPSYYSFMFLLTFQMQQNIKVSSMARYSTNS